MKKALGCVLSFVLLLGATGCSINGINGLINGSKIDLSSLDLSNVDVSSLASQATALLSTYGG